jgi:dTDP-glucose pyrophosphorylase
MLPGDAPTDLQNASFYLFPKAIFEYARTLPVNPARGEFEITDAINAYVADGGKIAVEKVNGEYMECGSVNGWLRANERIVRQD